MTLFQKIVKELKFWEDCRGYGLSIWQCPSFLFIVMGFITIVAMLSAHIVASKYGEPEYVVVSVVGSAIVIFTLGHIIVRSFEQMANANRMKTEFVSIVSHQLRTPLSALKWSFEVLSSGESGEIKGELFRRIETMRADNERMISLVNDLLNVTRIEQGRLLIRNKKFDLYNLLESLVKEVENFAKANNVSLEMENSGKHSTVYADEQYIRMVVGNLLDNAIRYIAKKGTVKIVMEDISPFIRVKIVDDGVGIPKGDQHNIFEKFFRSKNVMRHRTEGSGLGLYLAKAFIEMHKGKIGFSSIEGKGSTFWVEIPTK